MEVVFTVAVIYICYNLTVNTRNRRELRRLGNEMNEIKQLLEMALLYGKEKEESKEASKTGSKD